MDITRFCKDVIANPALSNEDINATYLDANIKIQAAVLPAGTADWLKVGFELQRTSMAAYVVQINTVGQALNIGQNKQAASRIITEAQRKTALDELTAVEGLVTGIVRNATEQAALRKELFPQGLTAFGTAGVDDLPELFETFMTVLTANADKFGPMRVIVVENATQALVPYAALRKQQKEDKDATGTARTDYNTLRPLLTQSLTNMMHLACLIHAPNYELALSWINVTLLTPHRVSNPAGTHHRTVAAGAHHSLYDLAHGAGVGTTTATIRIPNGAGGPLLVGRAADARAVPDMATAQAVLPGQELVFELSTLGAGDWLVCQNNGTRQLEVTVVLE